jgi:hypothetical protein
MINRTDKLMFTKIQKEVMRIGMAEINERK